MFQHVQSGREQLETTESIIAEAVYVLSSRKQYGLSPTDVVTRLTPIVTLRGLHTPRKRIILRAFVLYQQYPQFDFEDALSVAAMEQRGITEIVSYDTDFDGLPTIARQEP